MANTGVAEFIRCLEGRRVSVALVDGSRGALIGLSLGTLIAAALSVVVLRNEALRAGLPLRTRANQLERRRLLRHRRGLRR